MQLHMITDECNLCHRKCNQKNDGNDINRDRFNFLNLFSVLWCNSKRLIFKRTKNRLNQRPIKPKQLNNVIFSELESKTHMVDRNFLSFSPKEIQLYSTIFDSNGFWFN